MSDTKNPNHQLTRRSFLKTTGAVAGAAAVGATVKLGSVDPITTAHADGDAKETVISTSCRSNCFQRCLLNAHVVDGKVRYMSRGDYPEDIYSGCCLKGLTVHERAYSPTRIQYPMRRVGERGGGEWERISWDEAITEIADTFAKIRNEYGKTAIAFDTGSGNYSSINGSSGVKVLFAKALEATILNVCYDQAFGYGTDRVIGGGVWQFSNEPKTMLDSRHILVWGANPVSTQPQTYRLIRFAKERGAKITCIDPMFSSTAARADEYIPIRPGTDVLVSLAILNEIVSNDAIDEQYVKAYTTAPFLIRKDNGLIFRRSDIEGGEKASERTAVALNAPSSMADDPAYVWDSQSDELALSTECVAPALEGEFEIDGVAVETVYSGLKKHVAEYTVARATEASRIPEETIRELARRYAEEGPIFLYSIYGIDHYRNGHLFSQTMAVLHALTNNISRPGSSVGGSGGVLLAKLPVNSAILNPASGKAGYMGLPQCDLANVLVSGKHNGKDFPVKALFLACSNAMSNYAEQQRWFDDILPNLDYIVTCDTEFTDSARYSDIVLPVAFWTEVTDVSVSNYANPFVSFAGKAMEPLHEAKPDSEIFALIAEKLGLGDDVPLRSSEEWVEMLLDSDGLREMGITYETLKEKKAFRGVASEDQPMIRGFGGAPFPTPSGRAELYKERPLPRVDFGQDWEAAAEAERFPSFRPPTENYHENGLKEKYPLSYLTTHERWRVHTQWFAVKTLQELDTEPLVYLSPEDAEERGIADGDAVEVFNDRGSMAIKAVVSDACPPGVLNIPKGWQRNQCIEGGYQCMTGSESDPMSVNFAYFDALVDVRKK